MGLDTFQTLTSQQVHPRVRDLLSPANAFHFHRPGINVAVARENSALPSAFQPSHYNIVKLFTNFDERISFLIT
jgi:uncharacterized protein (DUF3084 family)